MGKWSREGIRLSEWEEICRDNDISQEEQRSYTAAGILPSAGSNLRRVPRWGEHTAQAIRGASESMRKMIDRPSDAAAIRLLVAWRDDAKIADLSRFFDDRLASIEHERQIIRGLEERGSSLEEWVQDWQTEAARQHQSGPVSSLGRDTDRSIFILGRLNACMEGDQAAMTEVYERMGTALTPGDAQNQSIKPWMARQAAELLADEVGLPAVRRISPSTAGTKDEAERRLYSLRAACHSDPDRVHQWFSFHRMLWHRTMEQSPPSPWLAIGDDYETLSWAATWFLTMPRSPGAARDLA